MASKQASTQYRVREGPTADNDDMTEQRARYAARRLGLALVYDQSGYGVLDPQQRRTGGFACTAADVLAWCERRYV
jgi:hypothetical protein